jgi:hypothetical protein
MKKLTPLETLRAIWENDQPFYDEDYRRIAKALRYPHCPKCGKKLRRIEATATETYPNGKRLCREVVQYQCWDDCEKNP